MQRLRYEHALSVTRSREKSAEDDSLLICQERDAISATRRACDEALRMGHVACNNNTHTHTDLLGQKLPTCTWLPMRLPIVEGRPWCGIFQLCADGAYSKPLYDDAFASSATKTPPNHGGAASRSGWLRHMATHGMLRNDKKQSLREETRRSCEFDEMCKHL